MAGIRDHKEFAVWQLAKQLEREVIAFTSIRPAAADIDYCRDIRRSARSAPRNIAEGFGRFYPGEFAKFTRNALGSLRETQDHLDAALDDAYLTREKHKRLFDLANRAIGAGVRLVNYLDHRAVRDARHKPRGQPLGPPREHRTHDGNSEPDREPRAPRTRNREPGTANLELCTLNLAP